jgi:hypothetical protein
MRDQKRLTDKEMRAYIVLDLENECGGSELVPVHAKEVRRHIQNLALPYPSQTVIAVGSRALSIYPQLHFDWPKARILCRPGIDGADLCLCEVLVGESTARRSACVVIGSGDGKFAEPAAFLKAQGTKIIVVGRRGAISNKLLGIADNISYFDDKAFHSGSTNIMVPS